MLKYVKFGIFMKKKYPMPSETPVLYAFVKESAIISQFFTARR
jgi:hypothetical protein